MALDSLSGLAQDYFVGLINMDISCKCHKGEGYHYEIGNGQTLWLCNNCNMLLAQAMFRQAATRIFGSDIFELEEFDDGFKVRLNKRSDKAEG